MLLLILLNTGVRMNEALTRSDFVLTLPWPFVQLSYAHTADVKGGENCGHGACRHKASTHCVLIRSPLGESAANDGGHTENSA